MELLTGRRSDWQNLYTRAKSKILEALLADPVMHSFIPYASTGALINPDVLSIILTRFSFNRCIWMMLFMRMSLFMNIPCSKVVEMMVAPDLFRLSFIWWLRR